MAAGLEHKIVLEQQLKLNQPSTDVGTAPTELVHAPSKEVSTRISKWIYIQYGIMGEICKFSICRMDSIFLEKLMKHNNLFYPNYCKVTRSSISQNCQKILNSERKET